MPTFWSSFAPSSFVERLLRADQRNAAARDHAFFNGRTGRVQRVFDAGLLFLHLDLGRSADLDHGDAAGELGNALLELLLVVVGGGFFDLLADLLDAALDVRALAGAVDDRGVFLLDDDLLGLAEIVRCVAFSSDRPTSSEITVPPVRIAMSCSMALRRSPKPGALTAATLTMPRMLLTTSVASASPSTSSAMTSSGRPDFATPSSSGSISRMFEIFLSCSRITGSRARRLAGLVVDEVRREVAAVELHALDDVELVLQARAFFNRDHAFLADLLHRLGDGLADRLVGVRGDRADLRDRLVVLARLRELLELFDGRDRRPCRCRA